MIVPEDHLCIQQMLGIEVIPKKIEEEYGIRIRMYHRQGAGGPLGVTGLIDMLRFLGCSCGQAKFAKQSEQIDWRRIDEGTPVQVQVGNEWLTDHATFQGSVSAGSLAVERGGQIDEFNAFDVRLVKDQFPDDVDEESFKGDPDDLRHKPDDRINLVEAGSDSPDDGDIGDAADAPPPKKVNWAQVKKGTPVWYRDPDSDRILDAKFMRCLSDGKANVQVEGEDEIREGINRSDLVPAN
ncbi:MAG: hypothetical protein AAFV88_04360 [Planctomycetota bacterium]